MERFVGKVSTENDVRKSLRVNRDRAFLNALRRFGEIFQSNLATCSSNVGRDRCVDLVACLAMLLDESRLAHPPAFLLLSL